MPGKRAQNRSYEVHGEGLASLARGFDELGMPSYRRPAAVRLVEEILSSNRAADFYWYKPPSTDELCCYWDDSEKNLLWINQGELHVLADEEVVLPERPTTYAKDGGHLVGWHLPGGESGTGGGPRLPKPASSMCPVTFIAVPAGTVCPDCDEVHET